MTIATGEGGIVRALYAFVHFLEHVAMAIAGVCFVAMTLITTTDVVLRYAFNSPLGWAYPVIENYLMVASYFGAVAATQRHRQHIGMDGLVDKLTPRLKSAVIALGLMLTIVYCMLVAQNGWGLFVTALQNNEIMTGDIAWPRWPTYLAIPLGFGLLSIRLFCDVCRHLYHMVTGVPEMAAGTDELAVH